MIYFIQCGKNGPIKIGQTDNDIQQRIAQLQTGCPYELRLLWVYTGDRWTETQIHEELSHERIRGEWFHPSEHLFWLLESELFNSFEFNTYNGRSVEFIENFNGEDEISFNNGIRGPFLAASYSNIFHKYMDGEIYFAPSITTKKVLVDDR